MFCVQIDFLFSPGLRSAPNVSVKELLQLHSEFMFVRNGADKESLKQYMKVHEKSKIVDQKLFKQYQEYQAGFQERLDTLRALPRKNPKTAGHDKNMPPILKQFKGAAGSVQDAKNFWTSHPADLMTSELAITRSPTKIFHPTWSSKPRMQRTKL